VKLDSYLQQVKQTDLAEKLGISQGLVSMYSSGARTVPIERCVEIERATDGQVTRQELRPDDWHKIWPELVETTS
jgi:DNA-binding transcriptional regulator YdaS (Cro superfamily)